MRKSSWLIATALVPFLIASATASPANLDVKLKPHQSNGHVDYVDVSMTLENPQAKPGSVLVHMPLVVASIPTQRYDGTALSARDSKGPLDLSIKDDTPTPFLTYRNWQLSHATEGDVTISYRAVPRAVDSNTRNGPLFDLREEAGGLNGAGFTFIAPPVVCQEPYNIHLKWDLSSMPAGSRGIWSLGEGDASVVRPAELLATSFYFAGPVKSYPEKSDSRFHMYWLNEPPFDAKDAAGMISRLFDFTSHFFHDDKDDYRVFIRKNPYKYGGGTALARSFLFAYGNAKAPTAEDLKSLIGHEMVHNWPMLAGDHADTSWYTEGSAEYYSALLAFRAGLFTPEEFLKNINKKISDYYQNPVQSLSNRDAEQIYWKDARAGHVPYGRGFFYLANVNTKIREKSKGARSLDDIVVPLSDRSRNGEEIGVEDWLKAITAELGEGARTEYVDMVAGKPLASLPNMFGPCFKSVAISEYQQDLGFDVLAYMGKPRIVKGLVTSSEAASAGLKDGDLVVEGKDVSEPSFHYDEPITIKVLRDGKELSFTFMPRGRTVTGYQWVRDKTVPDAQCKL